MKSWKMCNFDPEASKSHVIILIESFRFWDEEDYEYEIFSILSTAQNARSFIILLSGEGLTSFSINNRTNLFGEKR